MPGRSHRRGQAPLTGEASGPPAVHHRSDAIDFGANSMQAAMFAPAASDATDEWWDVPTRERSGGMGLGAPRPEPKVVAPPTGPKGHSMASPLAQASGMSDTMAQKAMALKQARSTGAVGSSKTAAKSTPIPENIELSPQDERGNHLRKFRAARGREQEAELAALGGGRNRSYLGADEQMSDVRAMVDDPRMQARYQLDRKSDRSATGRAGAAVKEKVTKGIDAIKADPKGVAGRTLAGAVPLVGAGLKFGTAYKEDKRADVDGAIAGNETLDPFTRSMARGFETKHNDGVVSNVVGGVTSLASDAVKIATFGASGGFETAASTVADAATAAFGSAEGAGNALISGLSSIGSGGGGGGGMGVDGIGDRISSAGAAIGDGVMGGLGKAGDLAAALPGEAGDKVMENLTPEKLAERAGKKTATTGVPKAQQKTRDYLYDNRSPSKIRQDAIGPSGKGQASQVKEKMDGANEAVLELATRDTNFGNAALGYLGDEEALPTDAVGIMQASRTGDGRGEDASIRPSAVVRVQQGEAARQRQLGRMGDVLPQMRDNEKKSRWEAR